MEWTIQDQYTPTRIVETEALLELKQWIKDHHCQCWVDIRHCNPVGTVEERRTLNRPLGAIGPYGPTGYDDGIKREDTRVIAESKRVFVNIQFVLSNTQGEKIVLKKLPTTVNHVGDSLKPWHVSKLTEHVPYKRGIYKRPGFDRAFEGLKALKPQLTELDFAKASDDACKEWDSDLVECRLFDGMDGCLQTATACDIIETGKSRVTLSLLAVDIPENLEYIKHILVPQKK
jgi:hypothetical protein